LFILSPEKSSEKEIPLKTIFPWKGGIRCFALTVHKPSWKEADFVCIVGLI
jgi:hypothetical protein